jgi:hypothetical protein
VSIRKNQASQSQKALPAAQGLSLAWCEGGARRVALYQYWSKSLQVATILPARGHLGRSVCVRKAALKLHSCAVTIVAAAAWKAARRFGCGSTALGRIADLKSAMRRAGPATAECNSAIQQIEKSALRGASQN